ncbi:hypothetical protein HOY34_04485 [Xinfangfangia sp. D13-10-4-6]|uniref:hypothetical protein n=1 Tax=Pseudogemmobacter hezensis TaxID=2737662 RepID=UPI001557B63D|nr:hypothetical protein [Pseudogemmobacter hezensis]NPD14456.1 hypothetical protein [Pseudogemmobacter hezensis]
MKRRQFITAAPVAALAPLAVCEAPSVAAPAPAENPALLALGQELPGVEAAYHNACTAWDAMWREWHPQWPLAPDPCVVQGGGWIGEIERDLNGSGLVRPGQDKPMRRLELHNMESRRDSMLAALARDAKRKKPSSRRTLNYWQSEIDRAELGIALLPGYLSECERIRKASDFEALEAARVAARDRMFDFARQVLGEPAATIEGVRIKARAVAALGNLRPYDATWGNLRDMTGPKGHMGAMLGRALLEVLM